MSTTKTSFYVLTEGATQEEEFTWEAIEEMCRSGQLSADTRIFFPDKNKWLRAGETELKSVFKKDQPKARANKEKELDSERGALQAEYDEAIRQIGEQPEAIEPHLEAGRVASEMGDRGAAHEHFQKALDLWPFHSRVAQEVQRRFSKSECKEFRYLRRDPPAWDEPADLAVYPLARGALYVAVPAAVLFLLSLVPYGWFVAGPLAYLWLIQAARHVAAGDDRPPLWHGALANPVREIILPLLAGAAVVGECVLVVYGAGRLGMLLAGGSGSAFSYVAGSPVLSVTLMVVSLAYLPAVLVRITHSVGIIVDLLLPWTVVRVAVRLGQEYAVSALLLLSLAFLLGSTNFLIGGIPLLGMFVIAAIAALAIPVAGFILGRLAGRTGHVL